MQEAPLSSSSSSPPFIHDEQVLNYILRICQEEWQRYFIDSETSPTTTMPEESVTALAMVTEERVISSDHEEVLSNIFRICQEEWQQYVIDSKTSPTTAVPEESVTGSGMVTEERVISPDGLNRGVHDEKVPSEWQKFGDNFEKGKSSLTVAVPEKSVKGSGMVTEERVISPDGLNRRIHDEKVPSEWQKFGDNFEKGKSSLTVVVPEKSVNGSTMVTEERVMSQDGINRGIHDEKVPRKWQNFERGGSSLTGAAPDESVTISGIDVMICDPECFLISELGKPLVDEENESLMNRVDVGICVTCFCNEYMVHQYGRESEYREVWLRCNESILDRLLYLKSSVICLQDFGVANEDFVKVYEMQLKEVGYQAYKVGRGNGSGLLTAVRRDHFYVLNHKELLFNDFDDHMVQLLHVELLVPSSRTRKEALVVNTNLIFPHDSTYCFRRLQQVYNILQQIKLYCDQQCLPPVPIILCGVWNGSKKGHVYKFLHSQGFVTSYDAAHHCADNDEDSHKWISHCNHRGTSCAVDFIWLLNPNKHQKPLKESFTEAVGNMLEEENEESRVQTNDPRTSVSDESLRVRVPDTDSRDLEIGCSIPDFTPRSSQSTRKVWINRCYKGSLLVSILGNIYSSVVTQFRLEEKASWVQYMSYGMAILQLLAHASCYYIDYFVTKERKKNLKRDVFCLFIFSCLLLVFVLGCTKFPEIYDIGIYGMASNLLICFHLLLSLYADRY